MKNTDVLKNLERILDSETKNYLESSERLIVFQSHFPSVVNLMQLL